jgi:beta-glucosidase
MCAYNRYLGEPCCGSIPLQEELLRGELGFQGYIVSDCGAIRDFHSGHNVVSGPEQAAAAGIRAGTDLNCGRQYLSLVKAVEAGMVSEMEIDVGVRRLMLARMKLGMFDPEHLVPWSGLNVDTVSCDLHLRTALEMARKSLVLLKNENGALPLKKDLQKIAVIGPNAHNVSAQLGNYNGSPVDPVSVFEGIKSKVSGSSEVRYALGSPHHSGLPYLVPVPGEVLFRDQGKTRGGLRASYHNNLEGSGEPLVEKTRNQVDEYWWDGEPPEQGLTDDNYSVVWQGFLVPRRSGEHALGVDGKYFALLLDSDTLIKHNNIHRPNKTYRKVELEEGRPYMIKLIMADRHGDANCTLHWEEPDRPLLREAVQTALWADHVVLVLGLTAQLEGEEMRGLELDGFFRGDRTSLDLPEIQQQLIRRIEATGRPVTLVLMTGSALSIVRENERIPSILQSWYGGEAAGTAVADVLFGDYNPAGRLPVTFYKSESDLPDFEDYAMAGRTYRYFDNEVLYPFGYGIGYSEFYYDNLILEKHEISQDESLMVSVDITNQGKLAGEEVVQMYVRDVDTDVKRPLKDLRGFARVMINPGQTIVVSMELGPDELEYYDEALSYYRVTPGEFEILVGPSSSEDVLLRDTLLVR